MLKRLLLVSALVAIPHAAMAGPIVTWEAFGNVTRSNSRYPPVATVMHPNGLPQAPPVGTTYSIELLFDPTASVNTPFAPAGSPCHMTTVTGRFDLGGTGYTLSGNAFTGSRLAGTNCYSGAAPGTIEFFVFPRAVETDVWHLEDIPRFLLLSYTDLIQQDGTFPSVPTVGPFSFLYFQNDDFFNFSGTFNPRAVVDQSTPVPEPGTMALVGIGLAFAARQRRRAQSRRQR